MPVEQQPALIFWLIIKKSLISIALWGIGILFFMLSFVILMVCLTLFSRDFTFAAARRLFSILIFLMGIRLNVEGKENIDPGRTYLMMGNHQSLFDLFVIPAAIPLCFTGVEAAYHFKLPVWGVMIRKWGCIPIERRNQKSAFKSIEKARQTLSSGTSVCILPEGHRTRNGKIGPFKKGPFHLAKHAGADILPFSISGLFEYHSKGSFLLNPGKVTVVIGKPVGYLEIASAEVEAIREICFERIRSLSRQPQ